MNKAELAISELSQIDELASKDSPFHCLNPLCKFIICISYIIFVTSINRYDVFKLISFAIFPFIMYYFADIKVSLCFKKLKYLLPLVIAVGIFNPFIEKEIIMKIGSVSINRGFISMLTLMLKGVLALMSSFLLAATTPLEDICAALKRLYVPEFLISLFMLTYRYVSVFLEEVSVMSDAYSLRAPGQKGIHFKVWGSFLGQLVLRSMDKAERLFESMQLRGFNGQFDYSYKHKYYKYSYIVLLVFILFMFIFRFFNVVYILGNLI